MGRADGHRPKSPGTIPGGRASRRAGFAAGSDGASPSQNHQFREGEPPGEPVALPARTEPRPPRIAKGHLVGATAPALQILETAGPQARTSVGGRPAG